MKANTILTCILLLGCAACATSRRPVQYVETRIGTAPSETRTAGLFGKNTEEFGQCLPAVLEPHGMNFWTPQTRDTEQKCIAPYYYLDSLLQGFRNSHWIVGGCTQDYGSMTLMPLAGTLRCSPEARASRVDHAHEVSSPSYYRNRLLDEGITAEMTGRSRAAIFRFTYDNAGDGYLVVNPNSDEGAGYVEVNTAKRQIRGYNPVHRIYQGWGEPAGYAGYFVVQLDRDLAEWGTFAGDSVVAGATVIEKQPGIGAYVRFRVNGTADPVTVRAASSFTDMAGALANLEAEIPHDNFDRTRRELSDIWDCRLGLISVEGGSDEELTKFYSALYRSSFLPREFSDADGRYPSFSAGTPVLKMPEGQTYYEDYSMWDTYRAQHPLLTLITPHRSGEMMQSLVLKYRQGGWLPIFPCWNSYTAAMIGDHCIAAIADAAVKGVGNFDLATAYEGMRKNAFASPENYDDYKNGMGRRALPSYLKYGYIPLEDSVPEAFHKREQVSRTLEYAFDDFALSRVARMLGRDTDADTLAARAMNYRNVIDPASGYAQGRYADGTFLPTPENAFTFAPFITEGAPCHYTWYVPHDQPGLMSLMGGRETYVAKLDSMFTEGRYWHGNEPCHQVAWLFNYAGEPWKTQRAVRHIMETEYLGVPGGLSGNDDAGQMSAWYIFAALGFYPVCPATPYYIIGSPSFPRAEIALENGKTFTIIAENASPANIYIQSATLDGTPYDKSYISHDDILAGKTLKFVMGPSPSQWGQTLPPAVL